jgi:hypothetical protein
VVAVPLYCLSCREEDLNEAPMTARCAACGERACAEHDLCPGCGNVICIACNTVSPYGVPFAFVGDRYFHPHNAEAA